MNVTQIRTQSYFDPDRYFWLKQRAASQGKPIAQVIRDLVDNVKEKEEEIKKKQKQEAYKEVLKLIGSDKGKGPRDVSINHDKYLGEALYREVVRNQPK